MGPGPRPPFQQAKIGCCVFAFFFFFFLGSYPSGFLAANWRTIMRGTMTILFGIVVTLWSWGDVGRAGDSARPNILAIRGDDIGRFDVNACDRGMMGRK